MTAHYIKIALRNLAKHKAQTIISIVSIGVSVAVFVIISLFMFNINKDPLLEQDYVDDVALMCIKIRDSSNPFADKVADIMPFNLADHQFKTVDKIFLPDSKRKTVTVRSENIDPVTAIALRVDADFLQWCAYESAVADRVTECLDDNTVIISKSLGDKLFGSYHNAIGKQLSVQIVGDDLESRTFQIADVIVKFSINDSKLPDNVDIFHSADFGPPTVADQAYLIVRHDKQLQDVAKELTQYLDVPVSDIHLWSYRTWNERSNMMSIIISRAVMFFLYLFVIVSLSSALRQWLQLFSMRQREVAIRKSVGGKKGGILAMFITEELISIFASFILTIACCLYAFSFLENNFHIVLDTMNFGKGQMLCLTISCYLSIVLICLIADWYAVRRISQERSGLALQMKPKRHRLRNVGICIQIVISLIFISVTTVFAIGFNQIEQQLGIPSDKSRYEKGMLIKADKMSESQSLQIKEGLGRLESIGRFMSVETLGIKIEYADSTDEFTRAYFQRDNDVVDFYDLDVNYLKLKKSSEHYALVSQEIKDKMKKTGEWDFGKIMIDGNQYDIAGWFGQMPFRGKSTVILTDPSKEYGGQCHVYILPKDGKEEEAQHEVKELVARVAPDRLDAYPQSLSFELLGEHKAIASIRAIFYILLGISMITTLATIYAAISLDTRRRRKEMALRKINGAKSKDICRIFAKIYITIMGISILIAVPLSWVIITSLNETFDFDASPLIASVISVAVCVAAVFMTLYWKIRNVMNVDPVEYLKD